MLLRDFIPFIFALIGWQILFLHLYSPHPIQLKEKLFTSLSFGFCIISMLVLNHVDYMTLSTRLIIDFTLFYSVFYPSVCAYIALTYRKNIWISSFFLSTGIIVSHYYISSTHTAFQFLFMWIGLVFSLWLVCYFITSKNIFLSGFSKKTRNYSSIIFIPLVLVFYSFIPETNFSSSHQYNQYHISQIYFILAFSGLLVLYTHLLLSIKQGQLSLWRVVLGIVAAEFGIMFLLPPIIGTDVQEWIPPVLDSLLLSLFMLPLLFQQNVTAQQLEIKTNEIGATLLSINDGVIVCDRNGIINYFNPTIENLTGLSCNEAVGKAVDNIITIIDEIKHQEIPNSAMRCLESQLFVGSIADAMIQHKDGEFKAIEHTASPVFDGEGQLSGAIMICRDISEAKREKRIQNQEKELSQLLNFLLRFKIEDLSEQEILQQCLNKLLALSWLPIEPRGGIYVKKNNQLRLFAQAGLDSQVSQDCSLMNISYSLSNHVEKNQQIIFKSCFDSDQKLQCGGLNNFAYYHLPMIDGNNTLGFVLIYLDQGHVFNQRESNNLSTITATISHLLQKKRTLKTLRLSYKVLQHSHQGVLITDEDNQIIKVNPAFTDITGYTFDDVEGKTPSFLSSGHHDLPFYQKIWQSILDNGKWEGEIWNKKKDGTIYPEWLGITTICDRRGKVLRYIAIFTDLSKVKQAEIEVSRLAYFDTLTGLANRGQLSNTLTKMVNTAERNHLFLGVLFLDLNRFKFVNDTHGHQTGDHVLKIVGKRIKDTLRDADTAARWGGDEFVIILQSNSLNSIRKAAQHVSNKLIQQIKEPIDFGEKSFDIDSSIGISIYPTDTNNAKNLIQYADAAMYQAKQAKAGSYHFFSKKLNAKLKHRLDIEQNLAFAIENNEFKLYFQPKVQIDSQKTIGFEALLRWTSPALGSVSPAEFIPIAEETSLIIDIDLWVFEQVCIQLSYWNSEKLCQRGEHIAVNISSRHLQQPQFVDKIVRLIERHSVPPKSIQIEVTETGLMEQPELVLTHIKQLKKIGFSIAIDDFGTGYSSLASLKNFPIDLLKIDQSFIRDIVDDENDKAIVLAIIKMAQALGLHVCAEGVEEKSHAVILKQFGCEFAQGYFYAKPMPAELAVNYLVN